ncbi:hypothetical protein [Kitasatospora phosalacinea]|uniref:Uncharacterized protein n=1 Tax=Kitasatospora phosalacinea TaxID=2065 RepID=A0A9W6PCC3_9ACTN|nr:hypothetical protein [Kitasatospora phosalacinea]GLW52388.1 hypothetical protein Kpho01_03990 [Kitasatospora phosalacinea]
MKTVVPRSVDSVEDLLALAHLDLIQYYEVGGRRFDGFRDAPAEIVETKDDDLAQVRLMHRLDGATLAVRLRAEVLTPEGQIVADVAAFFKADEVLSVSSEAAVAFAKRVASPIIRPYLREAIQNTAVRLGMAAPLLAPLDQDGNEVASARAS